MEPRVRRRRPPPETAPPTVMEPTLKSGSLVLYRGRPAIVISPGEKPEIRTENGKTAKVRPKDIELLHPGPVRSLQSLVSREGDAETAWELVGGEQVTLENLAELVFDEFTPGAAWNAWELVADGLFFSGGPDAITARGTEEVAKEKAAREAKAAETRARDAFLCRARERQALPEDKAFLKEIERLALEQSAQSKLMRELGRGETPANAHALLLELGYWGPTVNPHPVRAGLSLEAPDCSLPALPDEERSDLTHLPAYAIDDEGSTDPDDAISLERNRLWVHVADVAALVVPDSPADLEARARGANLYRPEGTVTMLPSRTTHRLALGLENTSPALSFAIDFNEALDVTHVEVLPSRVKVIRRTYEEVESAIESPEFSGLLRLSEKLEQKRLAAGAVNIQIPEVKMEVKDGSVSIRPLPPTRSRRMVQQAMLLAGQAAALYAVEKQIPFPFTTQDPPEHWEPLEGLAGMFARRRSLKPSQQKSVPGPHAGMGLDLYSQVTSPLRRYLDLVAHQQLRRHLKGGRLMEGQELLERVGAAEAVSGAVRQAERMSRQHWTLVYLLQNEGWEGRGIVVEARGRRGRLLLPDIGLEVVMNLNRELPLNSEVQLQLQEVHLPALEARFRILS